MPLRRCFAGVIHLWLTVFLTRGSFLILARLHPFDPRVLPSIKKSKVSLFLPYSQFPLVVSAPP